MIEHKGYYSLIQYCPNLKAAEAVNVGVILFCPSLKYLKGITTKNNRRIIRFFGEGQDWAQLNALKTGIERRLTNEGIKSLDDLSHFALMRTNVMQCTLPRSMSVTDPEADLQSLYEQMIGEKYEKEVTRQSLKKILEERFDSSDIKPKIRRNLQLHSSILDKDFVIPFGYQNGRFNLITPVSFQSGDPEQSAIRACRWSMEGKSLAKEEDNSLGRMQLIVVGDFRPKDQQTERKVKHVLDEGGVKLYSQSRIDDLVGDIRQHGKLLEQAS